MCWLQIAKRTQRLYIALNLRLSFVETSSRYLVLWSGRQRGSCLTDWLVDWRPPQPSTAFTLLEIVFKLPPLKGGQLYPRGREWKKRALALSRRATVTSSSLVSALTPVYSVTILTLHRQPLAYRFCTNKGVCESTVNTVCVFRCALPDTTQSSDTILFYFQTSLCDHFFFRIDAFNRLIWWI